MFYKMLITKKQKVNDDTCLKDDFSQGLRQGTNQQDLVYNNIRRALDKYRRACDIGMNPSRQHITEIVSSICEFFDSSQGPPCDLDPSHCPYCRFVLVNPVTFPCGHSVCSWCSTERCCPKCAQTFQHLTTNDLKVNITLKNICHKWWNDQIVQAKKRIEAYGVFEEGLSLRTVNSERITFLADELKALDPSQSNSDDIDPSRISYLSKLKCLNGEIEDAKQLAKSCINFVPDWHIGYLRLAEVTENELLIVDAVVHYFQAYIRSPIPKLKTNIKEIIINILEFCYTVQNDTEHSSSSSHQSYSNNLKLSLLRNNTRPSNISEFQRMKILSDGMDNLVNLVDKVLNAGEAALNFKVSQAPRVVHISKIDSADFECSLCCRILFNPVTTPCGHTFCMCCLNRSLDHTTNCPLCKQSIEKMLTCDRLVTEFFDVMLKRYFHSQYQERELNYQEEINSFRNGIEAGSRIPIFVCTVTFPTLPCPLHIFEPRYKLLLRQCLLSNSKKFGMCTSSDNETGYVDHGCLLDIRHAEYSFDGRAIVDTVGIKRFKILERSMKDGYNVCSVEWLYDEQLKPEELPEITSLHDNLRSEVLTWFDNLSDQIKERILQYLGTIPAVEENFQSLPDGPKWLWWAISILPLSSKIQGALLGMVTLQKRLQIVRQILSVIRRNNTVPHG